MSKEKTLTERPEKAKKGWFRRYLERLAKENRRLGGRLCPS